MAKLKNPLELKWRSTRGGVTGQLSRPGAIARRHFTCHVHQWTTRHLYNSTMSAMVRDWRSLSSIERDSWDEFGLDFTQPDRYGNMISLSGFNWFVKLNSIARLWVNNPVPNPPGSPDCDYNPSISFSVGSTGEPILLFFTPSPIPAFSGIAVKRKLNAPISLFSFPTLSHFPPAPPGQNTLYVVANNSELSPDNRHHFFLAKPFDQFGRTGTVQTALFERSQ